MGKVIIVASGKGGTGKTSFCSGVSAALARSGAKVLVIDADAGMKNLDIVMGMTDKVFFSFADVMAGRVALSDAAAAHPALDSLFVLTAPADTDPESADREKALDLLSEAAKEFDFVIIDCPAGAGVYTLLFAAGADRAVIVATPDNTSLRGAEKMASAFIGMGVPLVQLAVNRVRSRLISSGLARNIDDAMDETGLPLIGIIPEDINVLTSANIGRLVAFDSTVAARAYNNIADRIKGQYVPLLKIK